jgi:hypothetical protein
MYGAMRARRYAESHKKSRAISGAAQVNESKGKQLLITYRVTCLAQCVQYFTICISIQISNQRSRNAQSVAINIIKIITIVIIDKPIDCGFEA